MNKQELIKFIEKLPFSNGPIADTVTVNRGWLLQSIEQLEEPQKPVVKQFVADWYEEHKDNLEYNIWDRMKYNLEPKKRENAIFSQWLGKTVNNPVETLIKMKLYGYEVEKEKRYTVKMKGMNLECEYLYFGLCSQTWKFKEENAYGEFRKSHTEKELRKDGFGWVFDCPGMVVKEVTE